MAERRMDSRKTSKSETNLSRLKASYGSSRLALNAVQYQQSVLNLLDNPADDNDDSSDDDDSDDDRSGSIGIIGGVVILCKAAMISGFIALPGIIAEGGGIAFAIVSHLFWLALSVPTLLAIANFGELIGAHLDPDLLAPFSQWLYLFANVCLMILTMAYTVLCLVNAGDFLYVLILHLGTDPAFCSFDYMIRIAAVSIGTIFLVLPFILHGTMDFIKYNSFLGMLCVLYVVALVPTKYWTSSEPIPDGVPSIRLYPTNVVKTLLYLSLLMHNFMCHVAVIPVYSRLKNRSPDTWFAIVVVSMVLVTLSYGIIGIFGYLTFGDVVSFDIISEYHMERRHVLAALIAMTVVQFTTYPLFLFCGREAAIRLYMIVKDILNGKPWMLRKDTSDISYRKMQIITSVSWLFLSLTLSIVPYIRWVLLPLTGLSGLFMFVFPGFIMAGFGLPAELRESFPRKRIVGVSYMIFGVLASISLCASSIYQENYSAWMRTPAICEK